MIHSTGVKLQFFILAVFLSIGFYFTVVGGISAYQSHNGWIMGDWLINYQGGFVRRGLIGEVIYRFSSLSGYNPGLIVFIVQSFCYLLFFFFSYVSLTYQQSLQRYWLLLFSPFIFYFQVFTGEGGYRKEILYFSLLAFLVWSCKTLKRDMLEAVFYIVLLIYPLIILTHEMLAVFLPYILILYFTTIPLTRKRFIYITMLSLLSVVAFLVSFFNHGDSVIVSGIIDSLESLGYKPQLGAISWLDKSVQYAQTYVQQKVISVGYVKIYFAVMVLAGLAYIPIYSILKQIFNNRITILLLCIVSAGSLALFPAALDWGRIIYINLVSLFLISLVPTCKQSESGSFLNWPFISLLSVIYFSLWQIPHFGGYKPVINDINSTNIELLLDRRAGL